MTSEYLFDLLVTLQHPSHLRAWILSGIFFCSTRGFYAMYKWIADIMHSNEPTLVICEVIGGGFYK